ncbi:hypothetical protein E2C01_101319 [Portunus trituberculatus]|uniref:Uncharacterized protein n=1 Tax=Portunus trituberculatus TaxID=210409 RepID=A0A5B7KK60_PORTR|nr:hypothetical protein [Portunus trituberculatus]
MIDNTVIARLSGSPLSGAAPKHIQTYRMSDPSISLGSSIYPYALLLDNSSNDGTIW